MPTVIAHDLPLAHAVPDHAPRDSFDKLLEAPLRRISERRGTGERVTAPSNAKNRPLNHRDKRARAALRNAMTRAEQHLTRGDVRRAKATFRRGLRTADRWSSVRLP